MTNHETPAYTPPSARQLLFDHGLPEDVIDGVLCLHAQELAATIRSHPGAIPYRPQLDEDGGFWWDLRDRDAAADLIDPTRTAPAAVSVPPPAPQAADRRARYAAAIAEGFRAFDADTTSDAYLDAELLDAVVAVADAEEAVTRAVDRAAVLNRAADFFHGLSLTGTAVTAREVETELRRLADEAQQPEPEAEPTVEDIARANVLALHQIGEQLAGIESWMWEHLANVRETAKAQPERPRCPHCQMPHDLTPSMELACASIRASIADHHPDVSGPCVAGEQQNETPEAEREPDPDCEHCDGSGLDPDAYFVNGNVWTHAPCSECLPEDDEAEPTAERVKHSGPETKFCVLCLSGEHERVAEASE